MYLQLPNPLSVTVPIATPELNLSTLFPFELDDFQKQAIAALDAGRSVVVCAPTGSGKTLIGEYAIYRAIAGSRRVFYTTPLKALSNQKWRDFSEKFGPENVGLLTGDVSVNRNAPVVVMTTEIFRNMLYGTPIGEVGTSLVGVEAVVLDECHYMNDRQRGTVWEESIIYCPGTIQFLALSATVANSEQLTDWINQVHGPTDLIYSDFRPVPLQFHFCSTKGLFPLLDGGRTKLNPKLRTSSGRRGGGRRQGQPPSPQLGFVLSQLRRREMLPAIYFIFSRRGCDQAVQMVGDLQLVTPEEAQQLEKRIKVFLAQNPGVGRPEHIDPLYRGIASHHAGLLPAWKTLVEELFQDGLVKVVFATETLAAGINMPARTTVISSLSKRTDRGHRLLNPSEFLQMAGRAGRRGMDVRGYVVTVQTDFEGAREGAYLCTAGADPLVSQFTPSYGMVLNLLQTHTLAEAKELVERSFGQYLATLYLQPQQRAIADLMAQRERLETELATVEPKQLEQYEKLRQRLREERRLLKVLQRQAQETQTQDLAIAVTLVEMGTMLTLRGKAFAPETPFPVVLVTNTLGSGPYPNLVCLSSENTWHVVTVADVVGIHHDFPCLRAVEELDLPPGLVLLPGHSHPGTANSHWIAEQVKTLIAAHKDSLLTPAIAPEVFAQYKRTEAVKAQLDSHPVHRLGNPNTLIKHRQRLIEIQAEIDARQRELNEQSQRHWEEFLALIEVLWQFHCLENDDGNLNNQRIQGSNHQIDNHIDHQTDKNDSAASFINAPPIQITDNSPSDDSPALEPPQSTTDHPPSAPSSLAKSVTERHLDPTPETPVSPSTHRRSRSWIAETSDRWRPSFLGQIAAALRGDNELWLALALTSGYLDPLPPHHLAAVCAALVTDISRAETWTHYPLSPEVEEVLDCLWGTRKQLIKMQMSYGIEFLVLPSKWEDRKLTALVEQWSLGVDWTDLCSNTGLDEGDVVRIMRRTLDFLCQIPHTPHLSPALRQSARQAIHCIDRSPVNLINQELISTGVDEFGVPLAEIHSSTTPPNESTPEISLEPSPSTGDTPEPMTQILTLEPS